MSSPVTGDIALPTGSPHKDTVYCTSIVLFAIVSLMASGHLAFHGKSKYRSQPLNIMV